MSRATEGFSANTAMVPDSLTHFSVARRRKPSQKGLPDRRSGRGRLQKASTGRSISILRWRPLDLIDYDGVHRLLLRFKLQAKTLDCGEQASRVGGLHTGRRYPAVPHPELLLRNIELKPIIAFQAGFIDHRAIGEA